MEKREMNFNELKKAMKDYNDSHNINRFSLKDGLLCIGTYEKPFSFTKEDYKDALNFINKYSMLKEDSECMCKELYYKGLTWDSLTENQKYSIVNYFNINYPKNFITDVGMYKYLFELNKMFVMY